MNNIAEHIIVVNHALKNNLPIYWHQDDNFQCEFDDIFDNQQLDIVNEPIPLTYPSVLPGINKVMFKPSIICRAEEMSQQLNVGECMGVEMDSIGVKDDGLPLFLSVRNRQEIIEGRRKWGERITYYNRSVWGYHRKDGVVEGVINFLLFVMCGQINTSTYNGFLAQRFSGAVNV